VLLDNIAKLLDFKTNQLNLIKTEFNHKFAETWMRIDGEAVYINTYTDGLISTLNKNFNVKENHTIEPIILEPGLYTNNRSLYYVKRIPQKQWYKSFRPGSNTHLELLAGPRLQNNAQILTLTHYKESCFFQNHLYLHHIIVGGMGEFGRVYLQFPQFEKEIKELWPQLKITLEPMPQPDMEKNLNDQFFVELR